MRIKLTPATPIRNQCLVLVGGSGDTAENLTPLTDALSQKLSNYTICSFGLSNQVEDGQNLLEVQSTELEEIFAKLSTKHNFSSYTVFSTSMGAYSTVRILNNDQFSKLIESVIFLDPADYYTSDELKFADANSEITWAGYADYLPTESVISTELKNYRGKATIHVVHHILRNYGQNNYLETNKQKRGLDNPLGYPRLSTKMIKNYYTSIPKSNQGKYLEVPNLPHAILRDGNISSNIDLVVKIVWKLLCS